MRAFKKELKLMLERGESTTVKNVIEKVLAGGAPGYYVTYEYALRVVGDMVKCGIITRYKGKLRRHSRRDMMIEIGRKCVVRMERYGESLGKALANVLAGGEASAWFMTGRYASQLYYRIMGRGKCSLRSHHNDLSILAEEPE